MHVRKVLDNARYAALTPQARRQMKTRINVEGSQGINQMIAGASGWNFTN